MWPIRRKDADICLSGAELHPAPDCGFTASRQHHDQLQQVWKQRKLHHLLTGRSRNGHCMPMQIDHDPNEKNIDRKPESFWVLFAVLGLAWIALLYTVPLDWTSIVAGFATGAVFMLWASIRFKHLW